MKTLTAAVLLTLGFAADAEAGLIRPFCTRCQPSVQPSQEPIEIPDVNVWVRKRYRGYDWVRYRDDGLIERGRVYIYRDGRRRVTVKVRR